MPLTDPDDENSFFMSLDDAIDRFSYCKTVNFDEIRLKGKFLRI